jgi:hypothetical protein
MAAQCSAATISKIEQAMNNNEALATETEAIIDVADRAIEKQEWSSANELLKHGLDRLGNSYFSPGTIYDTSMKLLAAKVQERQGEVQNAVRVRRQILSERLMIFQGLLNIKRQ